MELKDICVLIADDDRAMLDALAITLGDHVSDVIRTTDPERVEGLIAQGKPDIVITDMNFSRAGSSGREGLQLISGLAQKFPNIPIIAMTAYGDVNLAVESMKRGASDFIEKPWSNQRLINTIANLAKSMQDKQIISGLTKIQNDDSGEKNLGIAGESPAIKLVRERIRKVAGSDANVLLLGENGTGKDLAARAIHNLSLRKEHPFIKIDMGSIHDNLFESELFGAKKGAYTGLNDNKLGRLGLANGGTLFLDELSNLSMSLQSKLLSVLQNREFTPVGGTKSEKIDIRLISATNTALNDLLDEARFRQDLLYRVNTIEINMPPLRERAGDIPVLMHHFLEKFSEKYQKPGLRLEKRLIKKAEEYNWPGNVRELEHAMERAVIMAEQSAIRPEELLPVRSNQGSKFTTNLNLKEMEEQLISEALQKCKGNIASAARLLGITRAALYRRLEKYQL